MVNLNYHQQKISRIIDMIDYTLTRIANYSEPGAGEQYFSELRDRRLHNLEISKMAYARLKKLLKKATDQMHDELWKDHTWEYDQRVCDAVRSSIFSHFETEKS